MKPYPVAIEEIRRVLQSEVGVESGRACSRIENILKEGVAALRKEQNASSFELSRDNLPENMQDVFFYNNRKYSVKSTGHRWRLDSIHGRLLLKLLRNFSTFRRYSYIDLAEEFETSLASISRAARFLQGQISDSDVYELVGPEKYKRYENMYVKLGFKSA